MLNEISFQRMIIMISNDRKSEIQTLLDQYSVESKLNIIQSLILYLLSNLSNLAQILPQEKYENIK